MKDQEKKEMEKVAEALTERFVPMFVKECQARGIEFANEQELRAGLESAILIQHAAPAQQEQRKEAAAGKLNSPVIAANELLKQAMYGTGQ